MQWLINGLGKLSPVFQMEQPLHTCPTMTSFPADDDNKAHEDRELC